VNNLKPPILKNNHMATKRMVRILGQAKRIWKKNYNLNKNYHPNLSNVAEIKEACKSFG